MPDDRRLQEAARWSELIGKHVEDIAKRSQRVSETWHELANSLQPKSHQSFLEMIADSIKLKGHAQEFAAAIGREVTDQKRLAELTKIAANLEDKYLQARAQHSMLAKTKADQMYKAAASNIKRQANLEFMAARQAVFLEEERIKLSETVHNITGKKAALEFLFLASVREGIKASGQLNEAIIGANSNMEKRYELTKQIWEVQTRTGTNMQEIAGAAKALVAFWPKLRGDFADTLTIVTQMNQGLGVSNENAVQMARIFTINLKTGAREVADSISMIANSTSLAADEATRFAVEIGKAIRLLGPGAARGPQEVVKYVDMLAARMQDVGGDATEIVKMFQQMTKGTPEAFMLRGLAGIGSPAALGTGAGAQAAFVGIGRVIDKIVSATPGTAQYSAQLEAASQMLGITTDSIVLYRDMLKKSREPLDENTRLEQRWRDQMAEANKAFSQMTSAIQGLIHRAMAPLLQNVITPFMQFAAKAINAVSSNVVTLYIAFGALALGAIHTVKSMWMLWVSLRAVAEQAKKAAAAQLIAQGEKAAADAIGKGGIIATIAKHVPILGTIAARIGQMLSWIMRLANPLTKIAAAFAGGYVIGTMIDKFLNWAFPSMMEGVVDGIAKLFYKQHTANIISPTGTKQWWEIMADVRREIIAGNMKQAEIIFRRGAMDVKGLTREQGAQAYIDLFKETAAKARERIGLASVTSAERQTLTNDKVMIDQTKEIIKNTGSAADLLKDRKRNDTDKDYRDFMNDLQRRIDQQINFNMTNTVDTGPFKAVLQPR